MFVVSREDQHQPLHYIKQFPQEYYTVKFPVITYTERMDAEGLGRKLLLMSGDPRRAPEKLTVGTVTVSRKMLTLQALLSSLRCKEERPGPKRGFWVPSLPSSSLSPKTAASICSTVPPAKKLRK